MQCCSSTWEITRGFTNGVLLRVWDDEAKTSPTDLTGYVAALEIRKGEGKPLLLRLDSPTNIILSAGLVFISPSVAQINTLQKGLVAKVQLALTPPASDPDLLWAAEVRVREGLFV